MAPGCNPKVIQAAREVGLTFVPGVATATDVEIALEHGCHLLKFFPSESLGGLTYLRALGAPYAHLGVRFVPLGGVNEKNLGQYLSEIMIATVGGTWLAPRGKLLLATGLTSVMLRVKPEKSLILPELTSLISEK